jgi:predicted nucleic acid-binding protein
VSGFLVDTNVLSEIKQPQGAHPNVDRWLKTTPQRALFTSVIALAEIRRGIELMDQGKRRAELSAWLAELHRSFADRALPVTKRVADRWAVLSVLSQRNGTPLAIMDGFIAATALEYGLTMVTRNQKDFAGLGLTLLNPWT